MSKHRKILNCWLRLRRHVTYYPDGPSSIYDDLTIACHNCRWTHTYPGMVYER